jgi:hypothetical protein
MSWRDDFDKELNVDEKHHDIAYISIKKVKEKV